ncbi:WPP domain-associated protein-like [Lycium barbarum]|uniref:WPP domain-associated protein-like n=1 Tax=Lycium barbarum TaxID=112863 RepID=UPI00293F5736|nr:WPP domain-associated protein-like [Lycium barbarum]
MRSSEVLENGARNGNGIKSRGEDDIEGTTNGGFEKMVNGSKENENLGDEILEDFDTYWEDVNDRLMVSRMVSDSMIKGIVSAVELEAAERLVAKETELAKLKDYLQSHDGGLSKIESFGSPMSQDELESMNFRKHMTLSDVFMEHGKMGDFLDRLRSSAKDEFKKLRKSIQEKESGIWVQLDNTVNNLKMMVDTVFKRMDDMLQWSKTSLGQWQEEHLTQVEIEAMVMRSVIRTVQEDFEYKLWHQYAKLCGDRNEKLNDISSLRTELDAVLKSLSSSETGYMTSHGSHDADVFTRKTSSEHVTSSNRDGNEKMEDSKTDIPENFDAATLKHMSEEETVTYFSNIMTKMKRHHESILQKKTDEYFHRRADYLKLRGGSVVPHKKDKGESDILRKKIPEIIFRLDDILVENEKHPASTPETLSFGNLKDRLDSLLSENHQLRDLLKHKQVEVKSLLSQVSDATEKRLDSLLSENLQFRDLLKDMQVEVKSLLSQVSDANEKGLDSLLSENHQLRDLLKDTQVEVKSLLSQVSDANEKRLDSLLSENHQLRDLLKDTQVEVQSLLSQVSDANEKRLQHSLAEADMLKQIGDLHLAMEDSLIEASVREEVYTCFLRDLSGGTRNEAEELNLGFELLNDSNDTDAESTKFEIEDLEIECLILQEICGVISGEGIKEAKDMLKELYSEYLNEKDIRISLETKVIEMENKLKFEVEEKDRLKQLVSELEICVTEKENLATVGSAALAKKMGQFEQVLQELNAVKEFASQQQALASGCNKVVNVVKGQLAEALGQIEVLKEEAAQINKSLVEDLKEANNSEEKKGFSLKRKKREFVTWAATTKYKLFKKNAEEK